MESRATLYFIPFLSADTVQLEFRFLELKRMRFETVINIFLLVFAIAAMAFGMNLAATSNSMFGY